MADRRKARKLYVCEVCGAEYMRWQGRCRECGEWGTLAEVRVAGAESGGAPHRGVFRLGADGETMVAGRLALPDEELNRVLGGGMVAGEVVLVGGEPGIGKSTLWLQTCLRLRVPSLYVCGEESAGQVTLRAQRLGIPSEHCVHITEDTQVEAILEHARQLKPALIVVDSIQSVASQQAEGIAGSLSQLRTCAYLFQQFAKSTGIPVVLIGHVTKGGELAGPKIVEHLVDAVLYFEGERQHPYRILRTVKNRFGAVMELAIYEMSAEGLRPVNELAILSQEEGKPGVAVGVVLEGVRPLLVEVQALTIPQKYGMPQRQSLGYDGKRLQTLLAVMERHAGITLFSSDVFVSIGGGLRVTDPCVDMAVAAALVSAHLQVSVPYKRAFAGEMSLTGAFRRVSFEAVRVAHARRLGFEPVFPDWVASVGALVNYLRNA